MTFCQKMMFYCVLTIPATGLPAQDEIRIDVLVDSTTSWDGEDFAYPEGDAKLNVTRIVMPAGSSLRMHCHPVPLAGDLVRGRLEVRKENGETFTVEAGQGLVEVSRQWHHGHALEDTEILVVYAGAENVPNTVFKDGDPDWTERCR